MFLDKMSQRSLNIFTTDVHPNQYVNNHSKEGLSLYGVIMDHVKSKLGQELSKRWLLKPCLNHEVLEARYDATEIITKPMNIDIFKSIKQSLKGLRDVRKLFRRLEEYSSTHLLNDWQLLWNTCDTALELRKLARQALALTKLVSGNRESHGKITGNNDDDQSDTSNIANDSESSNSNNGGVNNDNIEKKLQDATKNIFIRLSAIPDTVDNVHKWIWGIVDFKRSQNEGRLVPNQNLDENLDGWRRIYDTLDVFLTSIAEEIATTVEFGNIENEGVEMEVEYIPQIGYVIVFMGLNETHLEPMYDNNNNVITDQRSNTFLVAENAGMLFQFRHDTEESGISLFYKNSRMTELDNYFGDVRSIVIDMENSLIRQLHDKIIDHKRILNIVGDLLAEVDVLMAFASLSQLHRCVKPTLTKENCFIIEKGRHILQETVLASVNDFVPNDTILYPSKRHAVMIVTGPNSSGKSVYLKQIGLIAVLAHIGCYVPCTHCKIGPIDRIFTRISTVESHCIGQSAFTIDCGQMSTMLKTCTKKSLMLIDEFGKGTSSKEGPALLASCVCHIDQMLGTKCVLTTHFWEIFQLKLLNTCLNVKTFSMKLKVVTKPVVVNGQVRVLSDHNNEGVKIKSTTNFDNILDDFVPLFQLELKNSYLGNDTEVEDTMSSFGLKCAQMAGIDYDIIKRASKVRLAIMNGDRIRSPEEEKEELYKMLILKDDWNKATDTEVNDIIATFQNILL
eukprot:g8955.t1